jgi:hypothetical protein
MFERFCALLFRLYPLEFRRAYGRDAWQLIRDRARAERGLRQRARLLIDLSSDLFVTTLRGWHSNPSLVPETGVRDGSPRFHIIEARGPRPESIAAGMLTSILMFASFTLLFQPTSVAEGPARLGIGDGADASFDPGTDDGDDEDAPVAVDVSQLRHQIIDAVATNLKERYFDPAVGRQLGDALLTYAKNGAYNPLGVGNDLAQRLTSHIYQTGRTLGVPAGVAIADVIFIENPQRMGPPLRLFENCSQTVDWRGRVAYLKLNAFAPPHLCHDTITRVMTAVNGADALIIDLRDNGGGMGETALQIASYLFDRPAFMFDPRPHSEVPSHTSPLATSHLADKPVFILTSSKTQSAAEYFVYNLKMHKRVTIVGERTAGEQHSGMFREISEHFGIAIQEVPPPPSPFPVKGWETIGVEPDVRVDSGLALRTAARLAASRKRP